MHSVRVAGRPVKGPMGRGRALCSPQHRCMTRETAGSSQLSKGCLQILKLKVVETSVPGRRSRAD